VNFFSILAALSVLVFCDWPLRLRRHAKAGYRTGLSPLVNLMRQIASQLGTSEITVQIHRGNVMRKMQAESPAGIGQNVLQSFSLQSASNASLISLERPP
jgi:Bacterial regulatory proteins, luxR family